MQTNSTPSTTCYTNSAASTSVVSLGPFANVDECRRGSFYGEPDAMCDSDEEDDELYRQRTKDRDVEMRDDDFDDTPTEHAPLAPSSAAAVLSGSLACYWHADSHQWEWITFSYQPSIHVCITIITPNTCHPSRHPFTSHRRAQDLWAFSVEPAVASSHIPYAGSTAYPRYV